MWKPESKKNQHIERSRRSKYWGQFVVLIAGGTLIWMCPLGLWSQERSHHIHIKMVIVVVRLYDVAKPGNVEEKRGKKRYFQYRCSSIFSMRP